MARTPKARPAQRWPLSEGPVARALVLPCVLLIRLYQVTLSPFIGRQCRFHPTCSHYGIEAYRRHGVVGGTYLTARRILRCQPFGPAGPDPVPARRNREGGETSEDRLGAK